MTAPWKEWIPGALNDTQIGTMISDGFIENAVGCSVDYSSFDLRLGREGYEMLLGSVKPQKHGGYEQFLNTQSKYARPITFASDGMTVLDAKKTYVFKLKERLSTNLKNSSIYGQATAKSSVGRVDVLARLIVDGMHNYEGFDPSMWDGGTGAMFLEVTPISFKVRVKAGISLSQLRLFQGKPEQCEVRGKDLYGAVLLRDGGASDEFLRVDVSNTQIAGTNVAAFRAKVENQTPINLWVEKDGNGMPVNRPDPREYWAFDESDVERFFIKPGNFYILRSKERITLRQGVCVYCRAIDETLGEMRIHYAGFVHPYFGFPASHDQTPGTPLIFEVRGHDVGVVLNDNEPLARLQFYRMSHDCAAVPDAMKLSPYNDQSLRLSQFFDDFPEN